MICAKEMEDVMARVVLDPSLVERLEREPLTLVGDPKLGRIAGDDTVRGEVLQFLKKYDSYESFIACSCKDRSIEIPRCFC
jgi:hypothetical protein